MDAKDVIKFVAKRDANYYGVFIEGKVRELGILLLDSEMSADDQRELLDRISVCTHVCRDALTEGLRNLPMGSTSIMEVMKAVISERRNLEATVFASTGEIVARDDRIERLRSAIKSTLEDMGQTVYGSPWRPVDDTSGIPAYVYALRQEYHDLPFGQWYAADGTLMNNEGNRSIFDDVDEIDISDQ